MDRWQKELAERMKDPEERRRMEEQAEKMDPNNTITSDDLQKMLDKIREMAKNGDREGAKRMLEELRDAMQRQAGDEEIEKLIQQLYDAMARWQRELAEKMKDPEERRRMQEQAEKMDPNNTITSDDLQKMLDKIREMAKNGDREGAKRALEELRKMMENATPMMAQPGQQRAPAYVRSDVAASYLARAARRA